MDFVILETQANGHTRFQPQGWIGFDIYLSKFGINVNKGRVAQSFNHRNAPLQDTFTRIGQADIFGAHAQLNRTLCRHGGTRGKRHGGSPQGDLQALGGADRHGGQEIHRRRPDEACHKTVGGRIVQIKRRAGLADLALIPTALVSGSEGIPNAFRF